MNTMTVDGYYARIEYDDDLDLFRGEILGLSGGADFYGKKLGELRTDFRNSLRVFFKYVQKKALGRVATFMREQTTEANVCRKACRCAITNAVSRVTTVTKPRLLERTYQ